MYSVFNLAMLQVNRLNPGLRYGDVYGDVYDPSDAVIDITYNSTGLPRRMQYYSVV
jgi:hypothetical protein